MILTLNYMMTILLSFNGIESLINKQPIEVVTISPIAIINSEPVKKNYNATAQFWGRLATGVKQPSVVTLYPKHKHRLSVVMLLPNDCGRIFQINQDKITKVIYHCPETEKDESSDYTNWKVLHNKVTKEIKMISPATSSNNSLYVRQQAFWMITY